MTSRLLQFPHRRPGRPAGVIGNLYDALTDVIVMKRAEAGTLNPGIVAAFLAAVRQPVEEGGR